MVVEKAKDQKLLPDKMSFGALIALVVGNLVGAGVFMLPSTLAPFKGVSLLGWIVTSMGAMVLALIFAKLSAELPYTGGPHVYVKKAFGEKAGFFIGWGYWVMAWVSNSALVISIIGYLLPLMPEEFQGYGLYGELFILISLTLFNLLGMKVTSMGELVLTLLKVIPLIILPLFAFSSIDVTRLVDFEVGGGFLTSLNHVAFLTLWAFIGLETGTVPGTQVEKPIYTIPRAILAGTGIAMLIYILGTISILGVVPGDVLISSKAPYADMASAIFGGSWKVAVAIIAIIACVGTLHGWILVVGRIPQGAAAEGLMPKIFGRTNKFGSPYVGILTSGICTIPLIILSHQENLLKQFEFIIEVSVTLIFIVYLMCVLSYRKLLSEKRPLHKTEQVLSVAALIFIFWAIWATSLSTVFLSSLIFILGIPVYFWTRRDHQNS